jgi:phosphocarrier protein
LSEVSARALIRNVRGLHARASARFAAVANAFEAEVRVAHEAYRVSGHSIMGLMMLGAGAGDEIEISASGPQAEEAVDTLVRLIEDRFGEKE